MITTFECTECGARDSDKGNGNGFVPSALICWNCKAGSGKNVSDQIQGQFGMLPLKSKEESVN